MEHTNLDNEISGEKKLHNGVSPLTVIVGIVAVFMLSFWVYVMFFMPREADPNTPFEVKDGEVIIKPEVKEHPAVTWCRENPEAKGCF